MRKIAVFVEGQTEQIFVREFLLKHYQWTNIHIECYKLVALQTQDAEYPYGATDADNHYMIIDVGNDNTVLTAMLKRADGLFSSNYTLIVGLRDMYGRAYREESPNFVDPDINESFISAAKEEIVRRAYDSSRVKIHYAIMEVETWMLALAKNWAPNWYEKIPDETIEEVLENDLETIFHPYDMMVDITSPHGIGYGKHKDHVNKILSYITKEDFIELYDSNRCPSFNLFVDSIVDISE